MHDSDDDDLHWIDVVQNAKGKSEYESTPDVTPHDATRTWVFSYQVPSVLDLGQKVLPKTRRLIFVKPCGCQHLLFGGFKKDNPGHCNFCLASPNTCSAGLLVIFPALYSTSRFSAS